MADTELRRQDNSKPQGELVPSRPEQRQDGLPTVYLEPLAPSAAVTTGELLMYWRLLCERKFTIIVMLVTGVFLGWLVSFVQTPMYRANADIEIRSMSESDSIWRIIDRDWRGGGGGGSVATPETYLQTQLRLLNSRLFVRRVVEKLEATYESTEDYVYNRPRHLLASVGVVSEPERESSLPPFSYAAEIIPNTRMVELKCESPDPEFAAVFANTASTEFVSYNTETQSETAETTMNWLKDQLVDMRSRVDESEAQLQAYSVQTGLMFEAEQPVAEKTKLKDLQKELADAEIDRVAKQSQYEVAAADPEQSVAGRPEMAEMRSRLVTLENELKRLLTIYTPAHSEVRSTQAEIDTVQQIISKEIKTEVGRLREEYATARRHEDHLRELLDRQTSIVSVTARKGMEYDALKRDLERNRDLYEDLLQKATEVSLSTAMQGSSQIRVVEPAEQPAGAFRPRLPLNMAFGLCSGMMLAGGLIVLRERMNEHFRAPGETRSLLNVPELGVIPKSSSKGLTTRLRRGPKWQDSLVDGEAGVEGSNGATSWQSQSSLLVESFRGVVASILARRGTESSLRTLMVTGANKGEGKSTVAINLACGLAELGYTTVIVDADMRRPMIHERLGLVNTWGLSTLIEDETPFESMPIDGLAKPSKYAKVHAVPAGPGAVNVSSLLYSRRVSQFLERLKDFFDFVIVDTPPLLQFSDARLLGRNVDAAILVVRAGLTTRPSAIASKQRLLEDNIPVVGAVLNDWDVKASSARAYQNYGYWNS